jgi:uncharacterized SAM-binding protein YcdF (DUF218 family)
MSKTANWEGRKLLEGSARPAGKPRRPASPAPAARARWDWRQALAGLVLGTVTGRALADLGLQSVPLLRGEHLLAASAILGALLGGTRLRLLLWVGAGLATAGLLLVGYTPLIVGPVRSLVRRDALRPVEAVVVLSSNIQKDGDLTDVAQIRLLRGYEVLEAGLARRLVIPRLAPPKRPYLPTVRRQMQSLGLDFPIDEVGPVANTHDEAVAVARLARKEGWETVILVSDPTHLSRAAATFERAGLRVLCSPCVERNYDLENLDIPAERLHAFRDWLWETVGMWVYRRRGWA